MLKGNIGELRVGDLPDRGNGAAGDSSLLILPPTILRAGLQRNYSRSRSYLIQRNRRDDAFMENTFGVWPEPLNYVV